MRRKDIDGESAWRDDAGRTGDRHCYSVLLIERRYPKELCSEIAYKYLNTDYTATRMLGYLYRMTEPPAVEVVVDEMIAILSDREQLIKKKESEHAQAVISEIYREGL